MKKQLSKASRFLKSLSVLDFTFFQLPLCMAIFATFLFVLLSLQWSFCLTNASDPLQYVAPALRPEGGFQYLDRVVNWLWIRVVATLPLAPEMVGPVSTLILSSATLFVATWWLAARTQILAGAIFASLFIISPAWLPIATYTYPMQGLTFVLVSTLILMDLVGAKQKAFIGGIGGGLASLCKIQGVTFFGFLFITSLLNPERRWRNIVFVGIGGVVGVLCVFVIIGLIDGAEQVQQIFELFFGSAVEGQFHGRAMGGMPPFHAYLLEPAYLCAFAGMLLPWLIADSKIARPFALAALIQLTGLLAIYFLTQRGGPLIPNYVLDTFTLGIIGFSVSIVCICNLQRISVTTQTILGLLLLLSSFGTVSYFGNHVNKIKLYFANHLLKSSIPAGTILIWIAFFLILSFVILKKYCNSKSCRSVLIICIIGLLFMGLVFRGGEGVRAAICRVGLSLPYHEIAKISKKLQEEGVLIQIRFNLNVKDVSNRIQKIYNAFYDKEYTQASTNILFENDSSKEYRYVLTDQLSTILAFKGDKQKYKLSPENNHFEVLVSKLNKVKYGVKNKGYRGDAILSWNAEDEIFQIYPLENEKKFKFLFDLSPVNKNEIQRNDILLLHAPNVKEPADVFVRLYVQFIVNGLPTRIYGEKIGNEHNLWSVIPEKAEDIFYGWFIKTKNLNQKIILPPPITLQTKTGNFKNKKFPIALIDRQTGNICFDSVGNYK
jgi:hypothetical protein